MKLTKRDIHQALTTYYLRVGKNPFVGICGQSNSEASEVLAEILNSLLKEKDNREFYDSLPTYRDFEL